MFKEVKSCTLFLRDENIKWNISKKEKSAIMKKTFGKKKLFSDNTEEKSFPVEFILNLDVFFNKYDVSEWESTDDFPADGSFLTVEFDDGVRSVSESPDTADIFSELGKYFECYFEGKAEPASASFHSFDGGGPDFSFTTEVKGIFTWYSRKRYAKSDHEMLCGAGYTINYDFYPLRQGEATGVLVGRSPICPEPARRFFVTVDENLNLSYTVEKFKDDGSFN